MKLSFTFSDQEIATFMQESQAFRFMVISKLQSGTDNDIVRNTKKIILRDFSGNRIPAIKYVREISARHPDAFAMYKNYTSNDVNGLGLADAKALVEKWFAIG